MSISTTNSLPSNDRDAYGAAVGGDWDTIRVFYTRKPLSTINSSGDTVLHVLAFNSHVEVTKKLLGNLPIPENVLAVQNLKGNTPLHEAIRVGSMGIVKALVHKDVNFVTLTNFVGETPLYWAAQYGKREILLFLLGINDSDSLFRRNDNSTILHAAVSAEFYGLAGEIISIYHALALIRNDVGMSALDLLAQSPTSFLSGSIFSYKNVEASPFIPLQLLAMFIYYFCIPGRSTYQQQSTPLGINALIRCFPWIIMIVDAKQKHICAEQLVQAMVTSIIPFAQDDVKEPLLSARRNGIIEVVRKILKEFPEAIEFVDDNNKNILHLAVENKREQVFEFLKSKNFPISRMVTDVDRFGNTPLHLAAKIQEPPMYVHGAYQQMSWEVYWFQRVESISLPSLLRLPNYNGHTAKELFKETHGSLLEEAERWVKNTTNSHMVISTLIATINFTAAFTVPGGFNQDTGFPVFLEKTVFSSYLFFLSCALFTSLISLGSAFSANLSRFNEQDYYLFLPGKFLIGVASFFISVMCTVVAYALGLYLEGSPIATRLRFIVAVAGILASHLLTGIIFIDMVSPYCRSVFNALWHSLTYIPHSH